MGFFDNFRAVNLQAKVTAIVSTYLALSHKVHVGNDKNFSSDDLAIQITVPAIRRFPALFSPKHIKIKPNILAISIFVNALDSTSGETFTQLTYRQKRVACEALGIILSETYLGIDDHPAEIELLSTAHEFYRNMQNSW
ncbi:hypothetical protein [Chrysiogenes arsenatis]|uniref:hypothetical protein n=1 Tax=Chrysiogenes arsenatis TaxID=309797 RepID=UPI000485D181|nr:hypothetical protein [Chrysiogenes arsenatis]